MTALLMLVTTVVLLLGVFLAGLLVIGLLDRIPAIHERIEAWMPESPWWTTDD